MAKIEDVINQAIADFDDIKDAIEEQGVEVPYETDTKEYGKLIRSIGGMSNAKVLEIANKVAPSPATITIYANNWTQIEGKAMWYQVVDVIGADITPYSKVDLQLSAEQVAVFYEKDIALVTENDGGTITVYCIGGRKPENTYEIQATVSEVLVGGE